MISHTVSQNPFRFLEKPKEGQEKTTVDYEKDGFDFSDFGTEVDPGSIPF